MAIQMSGFRLFPEATHFWSLADYGAVLDVMKRLHPKTVLEFGPGSSTLALIEGGAQHIDCLEDDPDWFEVYRVRLAEVYPDIITLLGYTFSDPLRLPTPRIRFDLALVDGPFGTAQRPAAIDYALQHCAAVLVPTEEWREDRIQPEKGLRSVIATLATKYGRSVEIMETGPLSGAFALLT